MRITGVTVYQVGLPLKEGKYSWAGGKSVEVFDCTIVVLSTDHPDGLVGVGEENTRPILGAVTPLGPFYLPAYAEGAREGIRKLAPHLIGLDPREIAVVNDVMDRALLGHPYAKSPLDMACWDLLGKATGQPLCTLLGGRFGDAITLYRAISQEAKAEDMAKSVQKYRDEGYTRFQLKVGGGGSSQDGPQVVSDDIKRISMCAEQLKPGEVLVADANTGWLLHEASRIVKSLPTGADVYIEQPCRTYEECLSLRRRIPHPFVLDENIDSIQALLQLHKDHAADVINLKISKVGGLYKAKQIRDLAVVLGIAMTIEDSWGGDVTTAAIAALAHSTPERFRFSATDFNSYVTVSTATGAPQREHGKMRACADRPGLGVALRMGVLGEPVFSIAA